MKTITLERIKKVIPDLDLMPAIESGFVDYSEGRAVVPPVGELILDKGEVHIKYGYIKDDPYYVIKIASGFYGNPALGLPSGNGMMLLFRQGTGEPVCTLLDEGLLTDIRTAIAGAIAAKYLAPTGVDRIGIVGTGVQARLQLRYLAGVTECRSVLVWGRGETQLEEYRRDVEGDGFEVETTQDAAGILQECNLVVTTTPAEKPILSAATLRRGTHITAVGSDTPHKQELESEILARADVVVADSIAQCTARGEIFKALQMGRIAGEEMVELGDVIAGHVPGRTNEDQITVADLTGVAVQDIKIATAVYDAVG
jgi:ornithine cyclodeaminase